MSRSRRRPTILIGAIHDGSRQLAAPWKYAGDHASGATPIAAGDASVRFLFRNEREPACLNAGNNRRRGRSRSGERLRLWPSFDAAPASLSSLPVACDKGGAPMASLNTPKTVAV